MDIIFVVSLTFISLVFSVFRDYFIGYPLILSFIMFSYLALKRGYLFKDIMKMAYGGGRKVFTVLKIFILIGGITAAWMASGTVPGIVYYGIKFMVPKLFVLYVFLISSLISFLLGTAFGTVSTVGVALMVIARGGGVNVNLVAGAIIAGAYFGDRVSPMSSSANLVATLTNTEIYTNIKGMFKTANLPYIISFVLYGLFSFIQPLDLAKSNMTKDILNTFTINLWVLLPAMVILIMAALRVDVKISMCFSILIAIILSTFLQGYSINETIKYIFFGFYLNPGNPLQSILKGGGILSMAKVAIIVFVSSSLSGILENTNMLKSFEDLLANEVSRSKLFLYTSFVALATAAFGCNQSISIVLTAYLMDKPYKNQHIDKYQLALDIENTSVVLPVLIPWNIAGLVPATTLMIPSVKFLPYVFYLYLIPIINFIYYRIDERKQFDVSLKTENG